MTERPRTEAELIDYVRSIDERAPQALHERVQALVDERSAHAGGRSPHRPRAGERRTRRLMPAFAGGGLAAAVAAVAIVLALSGGGSGTPAAVAAASRLTLGTATMAAPRESVSDRGNLSASVDGVPFPYWQDSFGWHSTGSRVDAIDGRAVKTVFYADAAGRRIGYAIVGGTPPLSTGSGKVHWRDGHPYRVLDINDAPAVVWLRSGRLCVVSGRGVSSATLLTLASWHDGERQA